VREEIAKIAGIAKKSKIEENSSWPLVLSYWLFVF